MSQSELVIGLIGAVGTDLSSVSTTLAKCLGEVNFDAAELHLIAGIQQISRWSKIPQAPHDVRYEKLMDAGDEFRETLRRNDALALLGASTIFKERLKRVRGANIPSPNTAYILRSLKTPEEIHTLRSIYGRSLVLIAAYSRKDVRKERLAALIQNSRHGTREEDFFPAAERLIKRDEAESERSFGQNIREAFPLADFFVDPEDKEGINRIVELIFGNTFLTPTRDEYGMFHAWGSSMRSSALSRQVGASIATRDGEIVSLGCNEVPKAGGGQYWHGDPGDNRDHIRETDSNDEIKFAIFADVLDRLSKAKWFAQKYRKLTVPQLLSKALAQTASSGLSKAELLNIGEYGRLVHAEMASLMHAARLGISVNNAILYTTTFPCHNCAKHLIAAGIERVVYVEPYPKSYAYQLHKDSIALDEGKGTRSLVEFKAFVGVSPRRYLDVFSMGEVPRKLRGKVNRWDAHKAESRLKESPLAYLVAENKAIQEFETLLQDSSLNVVTNHKKTKAAT